MLEVLLLSNAHGLEGKDGVQQFTIRIYNSHIESSSQT